MALFAAAPVPSDAPRRRRTPKPAETPVPAPVDPAVPVEGVFAAAPVPSAVPRRRRTTKPAEPAAGPVHGSPAPSLPAHAEGGHVLFSLRGSTYAVAVGDVREISRAELQPVALGPASGEVALVDVRGRSIPVVDLRAERTGQGDVLLPMWRAHAGVVVDRVVSVTPEGGLVPETGEVPEGLPAWVRGVLRPVGGGTPVLLVSLPEARALGDGVGLAALAGAS